MTDSSSPRHSTIAGDASRMDLGRRGLVWRLVAALALGAMGGTAVAAEPAAATMMAVRLHGYGDVGNLRHERVPRPEAAPGTVRVRERAAGINPYDWKFRDGNLRRFFNPALPIVPGIEFAGVVDQVGAGVTRWKPGDAVYGYVGEDGAGAYAEYVVVPEGNLARKPASLDFAAAAAIPVATQTAWKALFETANAQPGQRVLLQGGSGAVGLAAIQLARLRGLEVAAVASTANQSLMRAYGANVTYDYRRQKVVEVAGQYDVVIDGVGAATIADSLRLTRDGGTLVAMNAPAAAADCAARQVRCLVLQNFRASPAAVAEITRLVEGGKLKVPVGASFPLAEAGAAQERSRTGGPGGKIVLRIAPR